jgi:hypothetical protein
MQANRDAMRANLSPLPRLATGAEILDVNLALDHHGSSERGFARPHYPAQQRWRPMGAEHFALLQVNTRPFHHLPTGGCAEQSFCEFNRHSTQDAGGMSNRSRIQSIQLPIFLPVAVLRAHDQQRR